MASTSLGQRDYGFKGVEENAAEPHFLPLLQNKTAGHRAKSRWT